MFTDKRTVKVDPVYANLICRGYNNKHAGLATSDDIYNNIGVAYWAASVH
jgi:hypothetical protein